jgi:mono/diheme cytochrome c family protein
MTPDVLQGLMTQIKAAQEAGVKALEFKSIPAGAATSVWAATAPGDAVGGRYCEDCHVGGIAEGATTADGVSAYAVDPENAKRLWAKSEEMVGERFPAP